MTMSDDAAQRMNRMYRFQRHIYDVTRRPYLLGRTSLINGLVPPDGGAVLEIGCGTGWNVIEAAQRYPRAQFYGFDISTVMIETAARKIARAGLKDRIHLQLGNATTFSGDALFGRNGFDRIFASYILSMIPDWPAVLEQSIAHLSSAGSMHIVDFGSAQGLSAPIRVGLHAWLDQFGVKPRLTLEQEVDKAARRHGLSPFFTEMHRGYALYAVLSRR